jgi:hypothetical protein
MRRHLLQNARLTTGCVLALMLVAVGGCGGGGSDGGSSPSPPPAPPPLAAPSGLTYPSPQQVAVNSTVTLAPTVTGTVTGYTVSPPLPTGLLLSSSTGVISGTAGVVSAPATYSVTASNASGSTSFSLVLEVWQPPPSPPSALSYPSPQDWNIGLPVLLIPIVTGTVTQYSAGSLPAGLSIDAASGIITGTPAAASAQQGYLITASNSSGTSTFELLARVRNRAPLALSYPDARSLTIGSSVSLTPQFTGVAESFDVTPALPAGLTLDPLTGVIAGIPTSVAAEQLHTITVRNDGGFANYILATVVRPIPPTSLSYATPLVLDVGVFATASPAVVGTVTRYTISPELPKGLTLGASTGVISGVPRQSIGSTTYVVVAANDGGSISASVTMRIRTTMGSPERISYSPFFMNDSSYPYGGQPISRYAWEGRNVAVLTQKSDLNPGLMQLWVEALDKGWDYYAAATGRAPGTSPHQYHGKVTIAQVPYTCGAGCGQVGARGIEADSAHFQREYDSALNNGAFGGFLFYEMGRNYWFYTNELAYKSPTNSNAVTTGFAVLMQWWSMDAAGVHIDNDSCLGPASAVRTHFEGLIDKYIENNSLNWANTMANSAGTASGCATDGPVLFTSILMRVQRDFGDADFGMRLWKEADSRPNASTTEQAVDNLVVAASVAAGMNLSRYFEETLRWTVSAQAKTELQTLLGTATAPGGQYPRLQIAATPSAGPASFTPAISWSSSNASSCEASGAWSGTKAASGSEVVGPLAQSTEFVLTCDSVSGSVQRRLSVSVVQPPSLKLIAQPATIPPGGIPVLGWKAINATTCSASGGWSGSRSMTGESAIGPLESDTSFTLRCTGTGGEISKTVVVDVDALAILPPDGLVRIGAAEFVELRGRVGHEGLFSMAKEPVLDGASALCRILLLGPVGVDPTFELVSAVGVPMGATDFSRNIETDGSSFEYLGSFDPPVEPFRIRVSGTDSSGASYSSDSAPFSPRPFGGAFPITHLALAAGAATSLPLTVTNYGDADDFLVSFQTSDQVSAIPVSELNVPKGQTRVLDVPIRMLTSAPIYAVGTVTAVITPVGAPADTNNTSTLKLQAVPAEDLQ